KDEADEHQDYAFNIFELDAASNNGVDDIRNLIDQVRIPPQVGKYKVYIIDEVHMLSKSAFNAFLKTLEEPPPYAIFIMATTEKHKVLPTILSRCQVFDFNRIQVPEMVNHLRAIAKKEGIKASDDALHIIAEKADGALRDALSIFDQMVSFSGNEVTYADVIKNLNILDYAYYFKLTDAFLQGDKTESLVVLHDILESGFDSQNFVNGLASHFRNLLFSTSQRTAAILDIGASIQAEYVDQSKRCNTSFLLNAMNILSEVDVNFSTSKNQRLLVEIALLKLCTLSDKLNQKKNDGEVISQSETATVSEPVREEKKVEHPAASSSQVSQDTSHKMPRESEEPPAREPEKQAVDIEKKIEKTPPKDYPLSEDSKNLSAEESEKQEGSPKPAQKEAPVPKNPEVESGEMDLQKTANPKMPSAENIGKQDNPASAPAAKKRSLLDSKLGKVKTKGVPTLSSMNGASQAGESNSEVKDTSGEDHEMILNANKPAKEFNQAQLWEVWDEYAANIRDQDKQSYYSTLTKHKAILRDNFRVELLIDNHIQKADLDDDRVNLLSFLRERLQNWRITLEGIIDEETKNDGDSLYDPQKKFEAMVESNPALGKLKLKFDLDVDYD
ncbi:MAG TPA: DNA polymerase III subunit gamma/tau, partial [Cryomorphaceae bacterium]|nr:DNA polymerase III subunit gamma/tau [Cryomorphaceae bacterium]